MDNPVFMFQEEQRDPHFDDSRMGPTQLHRLLFKSSASGDEDIIKLFMYIIIGWYECAPSTREISKGKMMTCPLTLTRQPFFSLAE